MEINLEIFNAKEIPIRELAFVYKDFFEEEGIRTDLSIIENNLTFFVNDDRSVIFAGLIESKIAAIASASVSFGVEFGWTAEMEDLYVVPKYRGYGLSTAMIGEIDSWARAKGEVEIFVVIVPTATDRDILPKYCKKSDFLTAGESSLKNLLLESTRMKIVN